VNRVLRSSAGFTYIAALVLVVILGIMLGAAGQSWTMVMKREKETELLFRGKQIVEAIALWHKTPGSAAVVNPNAHPLNDLKDLLLDPGSVSKKRYLRKDPTKEWIDPITGKEWEVIRDNARGGIIGVHSSSEETPLRQKGFLEMFYPLDPTKDKFLINMLAGFEKKTKYKDWLFVWSP
jgi:type II secretory pathway pseudopilin PulG